MAADRIDHALRRIEAAMERIAAARQTIAAPTGQQQANASARVVELVNTHERLREQVADALRDLDALIGQLEE